MLGTEGWAWATLGRWRALAPNSSSAPSCRLLVGAPQALALPGQQANRTGGLFACPLSLEETDCYRVDIDRGGAGPAGWSGEPTRRGGEDLASFPSLIPSVLPPADVQKESKENQWLGVSVRSQGPGGKIVVSTASCDYRQGWCGCVCTRLSVWHVCICMDVLTEHRLGIWSDGLIPRTSGRCRKV